MSDLESSPSAPARSRSPWPLVAGAFVVILAVVGGVLLVRRGSDDTANPPGQTAKLRPLGLVRGGTGGKDAAMAANAMPYAGKTEYRLQGTLPDLGKTAPVYKVTGAPLGAADVSRLAGALGITAAPVQQQSTWVATDGTGTLMVDASNGAWNVSFGREAYDVGAGSTGSSGGGTSSSGGAPTVSAIAPGEPMPAPSDSTPVPDESMPLPVPEGKVPPVSSPAIEAPKNLPSADEAEKLARSVIDKLGVTGDWKIEVTDGSSMGSAVACPANADCPVTAPNVVVLSRNVVFHRIVDGIATVGLDWIVEIGDNATIEHVHGVMATLEKMGDYPLRTTQDVYGDLVDGKGFYPGPVPLMATGSNTVGVPDIAVAPQTAVASQTTTAPATDAPGTTACPPNALCVPPGPIAPPPTMPPTTGTVPGAGPGVGPESTLPVVSEPMPEPPTVVITITGAERGLVVAPAVEGGTPVSYLVPTYRFLGTYADGGHFQSELVAIDRNLIATPETPTSVPSSDGKESPPQPPASQPDNVVVEPNHVVSTVITGATAPRPMPPVTTK